MNGRKNSADRPSVAIIGAGIAGLCMAIRLKEAGFSLFTIYEKSDRVGGTWRDNTYPGAGCDVPSHLYSFSFDLNPDWSRKYSGQAEIQAYIERCVAQYELLPHIRFNAAVTAARYDEAGALWRLTLGTGAEIEADIVVTGTGQLNRPRIPAIPGLDRRSHQFASRNLNRRTDTEVETGDGAGPETFGGTWFHSACWDHAHDLHGQRVAVVGNGASALQFIPKIAEVAETVTIYQRSANWIIPRNDYSYSPTTKWVFRHFPQIERLYRSHLYLQLELRFLGLMAGSWASKVGQGIATRYLKATVDDPALRSVLTPDYPIGCKRILISDDYYQSLTRDNVEVVPVGVERIAADAVVTKDGKSRPADTIVFATGFESTDFLAPIEFEGRDGKQLSETWRDGAEAYLGMAVSGFPNLFLLYGPNTNLGHSSIIFMIECQVGYIMQCLERMRIERLAWLDVRPEAQARFNKRVQAALQKTTWATGCNSWYKTASGKITNNWSGFTTQYWWRTRHPDKGAFEAG